ncbi:MAG: tetratricopeptide repeat protein [Nitrospirae bacterium]|nr:tetratricopeptide repeat protein [Nitrospirota bacterium]
MNAMRTDKTKFIIIALLLFATTVAVYWPAVNHEFINYDDPAYVTGNAHVRTGFTYENLRWAFTTTLMGNWNPVTWLSHMADMHLYGLNPRGHHLTSVILHGLTTLLLFIFLNRTTGAVWRSVLVALIFSLHPLRVESVAWVSERKDVLSAFFFMTTLLAYAFYVERQSIMRYLVIMVSFALGLMAKPMLVTLPFLLLLLDYWPFCRFDAGQHKPLPHGSGKPAYALATRASIVRLFSEKVPLLLLSAVFSGIAVYAQKDAKALLSLPAYPVMQRISNAFLAYMNYLGKTFRPLDLAVLYPLPGHILVTHAILAFVFLAGISVACIWFARRYPFLLTGWFWFVGSLVPVIGLIQVGLQAMADRYTYIPSIGLAILLVWGAAETTSSVRHRTMLMTAASCVLVLLLAISARIQLKYWENSIALFTHTVAVTENNYVAHTNLGDAFDKQGRYGEAMRQYGEALRIKPDEAFVYDKMATDFDIVGRLDDAVAYYGKSLQLDPGNARVHNNLGITLIRRGSAGEAIQHFSQAVQLDPGLGDAHYNLGLALTTAGKTQEAIKYYSEALRLNPSDPEIRISLEKALAEFPR